MRLSLRSTENFSGDRWTPHPLPLNECVKEESNPRDKPVIAQQTPCIVEWVQALSIWCQCGRSKMQPVCDGSPTGTLFSPMEIHFEEKKRGRSMVVSRRKSLPSVIGLTRGSNHVVPAANPHSECERLGGSLGASPRSTQTGTVQSKGMRYLVSMEEASGDALAR